MILLLGAGRQGYVALETLLDLGVKDVIVVDNNIENAKRVEHLGLNVLEMDVNKISLKEFKDKFVLVINCLPAKFGFQILNMAVVNGINIIDITYMAEDPFALDDLARQKRICAIVDAGFAPGISNFLVGYGFIKYGPGIQTITIKVGGIPLNPVPPFNYRITWSPEDLIEEYIRPSRILRDGKVVKVPALSGVEKEYFSGIGELESFYTDGLRSLIKTIPDVPSIEERTLRYPGHAEIFRVLRDIELLNKSCPIYQTFQKWLFDKLSRGSEEDIAVLRVEFETINGPKGFELIHQYNFKRKRMAMTELTGIPPAIIADMLIKGKININGVYPLELLAQDEEFSNYFMSKLGQFGILIREF
ncbi:MAG TPA: saccharopine dehydrogenase C-terminal domain-containing protein [Candidatus Hydrothermia bacterium]|nr:saccharopine dehydrogenase NADP-binding domain-containing protein [Candidatus Hydrothermae bacterium]MDD3648986.1 saccharopine dehydrogenase C-terminal domain-containing protein [Candidatus Hydrothermia bacterium]MDD5572578.1 saccharopine dehydrogenase C-terminal domain-containing protein [Candidatus Hydrothermia bacterium]HOK23227.1 saccharopine dehydrogenase C-terminal domain-containing protein [Candidatus Hydrothermia bacterium]HOL23931.1 saccharopine dehydrogenase C-terminal domain-conta